MSLLALWLAGAGCLLGCHTPEVVAASTESSSAHSCCHIANKACDTQEQFQGTTPAESTTPRPPQPSRTPSCCPLASLATVTASSRVAKDVHPVEVAPTYDVSVAWAMEKHLSAVAPVSRLPDRGDTYLRCCVFLI